MRDTTTNGFFMETNIREGLGRQPNRFHVHDCDNGLRRLTAYTKENERRKRKKKTTKLNLVFRRIEYKYVVVIYGASFFRVFTMYAFYVWNIELMRSNQQ